MIERHEPMITGHIHAFYPDTGETLIDVCNAIHFENISEALALGLAHKDSGWISEMHFGNGGSSVDPTGVIAYLPPNNTGQNADLYNPTYYKIIDDTNLDNRDPTRNKIEVRHISGAVYTDIVMTCLLDYSEPEDQAAFDNSANLDDEYVFDELGLKGWSPTEGEGKLLTHAVFHPAQKALNRLLQIDYTVRIQSLTSLSSNG